MQDFTKSLKLLVDDEFIDREVAMEVAPNREQLKMALKGIDVAQGGMV
jgi:twitching motility protein PilT